VIIGGGIAALSAATEARRTSRDSSITILSKEKELIYYRLNLTRFVAGEISEKLLPINPEKWYRDNKIEIHLNSEVSDIDIQLKKLQCSGKSYTYSKLIIASGSHAFIPQIPGADKKNVTVLRTAEDARFIISRSGSGKHCVIIGGGILGLEIAGALAVKGAKVSLLEGYGHLLPRQLNEKASASLEKFACDLGIHIIKNASVQKIHGGANASEVELADGRKIPCSLIVIAAGVRPNTWFARTAGITVNNGIIVDDYMRTNISDVFAAGDCAEHRGVLYGIWSPAQIQGTIAGANAAGAVQTFTGVPRSNMLKVLGYDLFSIGQIQINDASTVELEEIGSDTYACFLCRDGYVTGAILCGDTSLSAAVKYAIEKKIRIESALDSGKSITALKALLAQSKA